MSETSTLEPRGDVVVGVDGSPASVDAVRYALEEARRSGAAVRLVHVVPDAYVGMGAAYPLPPELLQEAGRTVLRDVLDQVTPVPAGVVVSTALRRGHRVATLVSDARGARVLVVGTDRRPLAARLLTGNTTTGVAASAAAPVVSVPETWSGSGPSGVVLVGVKGAAHATEPVAEAFALAESRASRLLVLHAWHLPTGYDDVVVDRAAHDEWGARARAELEALVAEHRAEHPAVEVELRAVHDQAAHALVVASREADELVLARRAHGPGPLHLGSTARAVLREAACPVRVVPPGHVVPRAGTVLEGVRAQR